MEHTGDKQELGQWGGGGEGGGDDRAQGERKVQEVRGEKRH